MNRPMVTLMVGAMLGLSLTACSSDNDSGSTKGVEVNVELSDAKGSDHWGLVASPSSVAAGKVTFVVKNTGTIEHEMVVLKIDTPYDQLPIDSGGRVSEDTSIGEVEEFAAGTTESATFDLAAGKYALVCNIAAHYGKGMTAELAVT